MDVTTQLIMAFRRQTLADIRARVPYVLQLEREIAVANQLQADSISRSSSICSPKTADAIESHIDEEKLYSEMGEQFLNYDYMRAVGCAVYSTFHGISEASGDISRLARLKHEVRNLHKFGSESVYGYALTGGLDGVDNAYVVKTSRLEGESADLSHELFVGLFALNKLRKSVPNFAMIFGGFRCSKAIINPENKKVESYCSPSVGQIPYVIYENISPSRPFGEVTADCTVPKFYSLWFQHLYSTHIASVLVGYTHYDLHPGNALDWKILDGTYCIPYPDPITKVVTYVEADSILMYIDYGMTAVNYNGTPVGSGDIRLEPYGVSSDPWPLHDSYKLLCFTAASLIKSRTNPLVLAEIKKIFKFFNKSETLEQAIAEQGKLGTYYSFPKMQANEDYGIAALIAHTLEVGNVGQVVSDQPRHTVLECTSCDSFSTAIKDSFVRDPVPTNFLDFYGRAKHLGASSKIRYDEMVAAFDYPKAAAEFKNDVNTALAELEEHLRLQHLPALPRVATTRDLIKKDVYEETQEAYFELVSAISHYEDVRMWLALGNSVVILFQDQEMISFINQKREVLAQYEREIAARTNQIREFYRKISAVVASEAWDKYNDKYPWYAINSGDIVYLRDKFQDIVKSDLFVEERLPSTIVRPIGAPERRETRAAEQVGVLPTRRRVAVISDRNGVPTRLDVKGR